MPVVLMTGLGTLLIGCSRTPAPAAAGTAEPSSILVVPATLTLEAGHDAWLAAQANDTAGQPIGGVKFHFTPADPRVLQVSQTGHVTSLGPASAQTGVVVASSRQETQVPVVVLPGAPRQLKKLSGDNQQLRAGEAPADPLEARLLDGWNNPLGNVHLTVTSAVGLFPLSEVVSSADGIAQFKVPPITRAGSWVVLLQSPTTEGLMASFTLRVAPGPPAALDKLPPTSESAAAALTSIALRVTDAHGNPIPDVGLKARASQADSWPLLARTDTQGTATFALPHGPSTHLVSLEVEVADSPTVHRSFTVDFSAPAASR